MSHNENTKALKGFYRMGIIGLDLLFSFLVQLLFLL